MFPSVLNTFNRPSATDRLNSPSHSALHNTVSSALGQVQAVIGTNTGASASAVGTLMYDVRSPDSGGGGHVQAANKGGTGQTTFTKGDILVAQSSSVLTKLAIGTDGNILTANSAAATGVSWGGATNLKSFIPKPFYNTLSATAQNINSVTVGFMTLFNLPQAITVNKITLPIGAHTTNGTVRVGVYSEDGQTKEIDVVTPAITAGTTIVRAVVSSVLLTAGNHYFGIVPMGSILTRLNGFTGDTTDNMLSRAVSSVTNAPVVAGTIPVSAETLPLTFNPSVLSTASLLSFTFRLDQ